MAVSSIWHPYTQHKTAAAEIKLVSAKDALLFTDDGKEIIDAVSSWWVCCYGHANPYIAKKIYEQLLVLDQVIFAGFTHQPAQDLSSRLLKLLPKNQEKVFFSDNGSTAVEVALKMAIQYFYNLNQPKCTVIALEGAYHGDTFGAMSAGERGKFFEPFESFAFEVKTIPVPTKGREQESLQALQYHLENNASCCFIFEPLVQGAAGMVMYAPSALDQLLELCKKHEAITIADEVMTGFGRTGKTFACDYLQQQSDIICLSKCLTAGVLPMSVTTCTPQIFDVFYADEKLKTLFHGHSYTGNPVGCAAALAGLDLLESSETKNNLERIAHQHQQFAAGICNNEKLTRIECLGTILALELKTGEGNSYFSTIRDQLYNYFLEEGILLRPLGNVIYILPPYCISNAQLNKIYQAIIRFLNTLE